MMDIITFLPEQLWIKLEIPAGGWQSYDTPGIIIVSDDYLSARIISLKNQAPKLSAVKSKPLFGWFRRFDFVAGDKRGFTAYFDNELKLPQAKLGCCDFMTTASAVWCRQVGEKEEFALVNEFTSGQDGYLL